MLYALYLCEISCDRFIANFKCLNANCFVINFLQCVCTCRVTVVRVVLLLMNYILKCVYIKCVKCCFVLRYCRNQISRPRLLKLQCCHLVVSNTELSYRWPTFRHQLYCRLHTNICLYSFSLHCRIAALNVPCVISD